MEDYTGKKVLVVSDTHIQHHNIIGYCGRPVDCDERMFKAFEQKRVTSHIDHIIHCGDFCRFYKVTEEQALEWFNRMFGEIRPTLIKGNHDRTDRGVTLRLPWVQVIRKENQPYVIQCQGLTIGFKHSPYKDKEGQLTLNDVGAHIQVHGHTHEKGQRFTWIDGISVATGALNVNACVEHWNYAPFNLDKIVQEYHARKQYEEGGHGRRQRKK